MYGGVYMKHYSDEELNRKINKFLTKKFEEYPEIGTKQLGNDSYSKPSFATRVVQSLTSTTVMSSN